MTYENADRLAEGIIRLRAEILRRRSSGGEFPADELTTPQALCLRIVVLEGPIRMGGLAERLGVSVATASRTVDALVGRNLAKRASDPTDARAVRVAATTRGRREHRSRRERFVHALETLMDELSEHERRQLAESLETLNRLLAGREDRAGRTETG